VVGGGIAGLRAAIEASSTRKVILVCKGSIEDSNTYNAQGGIASVLDPTDSFEAHINDTIKAGCGLCDQHVVELVVRQGPQLIRELLSWGAPFDRSAQDLHLSLEGGHSYPRIAHAYGDRTGTAIAQTLIAQVQQRPNIRVIEQFFAIDLLTDQEGRCVGVIGLDKHHGLQIIWANYTILATGGLGRIYRETTNPPVATGDGLAMASRAGAVLQDLEFVQFHPTTLYIAGASRALITEVLRGEGAILVDVKGRRFMPDYHPAAELAPRDVVSRAILAQMRKTDATHVYLDIRHIDKGLVARRFPMICEVCESFGIDVSRDLIPVRPSAHYMIGGVKTDLDAQTSVPGLLACGEVACTGLHGANRLGSNSLLEGLVFGRLAGAFVSNAPVNNAAVFRHPVIQYQVPRSDRSKLDTTDVRNSLRALMWRNVGISRTGKRLNEAMEIIRFWQRYVMDKVFDDPEGWECQNMLTVAFLMARSALIRKESRGVHFRTDHPACDDRRFLRHIEVIRPASN
jgi:L-aspartate oxidase